MKRDQKGEMVNRHFWKYIFDILHEKEHVYVRVYINHGRSV